MFTGLIGFVVGVLVGGIALASGARFVYRDRGVSTNLERGVVTALIGALVWALLARVPLLGTLLASVGWLGLLKWRYPGGWTRAAVLAVAAWAVAVVVLAALSLVGVDSLSAVGIPGT